MFAILEERTTNTLVALVGEKVTGEEHQRLVDAVGERLKNGGGLP